MIDSKAAILMIKIIRKLKTCGEWWMMDLDPVETFRISLTLTTEQQIKNLFSKYEIKFNQLKNQNFKD